MRENVPTLQAPAPHSFKYASLFLGVGGRGEGSRYPDGRVGPEDWKGIEARISLHPEEYDGR